MLNVSAKWQRAVMLDNDINVCCFADIVTASDDNPISGTRDGGFGSTGRR